LLHLSIDIAPTIYVAAESVRLTNINRETKEKVAASCTACCDLMGKNTSLIQFAHPAVGKLFERSFRKLTTVEHVFP
jgi:hypothetical protein